MALAGRHRLRARVFCCGAVAAWACVASVTPARAVARPPLTTVRTITRTPLPNGDRFTIVLSREVTFTSARLTRPERVFVDFADAAPDSALAARAATLTGLLVKGLRVGRQGDNTRVVLDLHGTPRYSAYPLSDPFRLVIEVESDTVAPVVRDSDGVSKVIGVGSPLGPDTGIGAATRFGAPAPAEDAIATAVTALSTFTLEKPKSTAEVSLAPVALGAPVFSPTRHESLRTTVGVGYVQGADWGSELQAMGSISGVQVQWDSLVTQGRGGTRVERGSLMLLDPDRRWRAEAGDLFSYIGGASVGGRVSWEARGRRRPAIAAFMPKHQSRDRGVIASYRDQWRLGDQTPLDLEIATDKSYVAATRWALGRFDAEMTYRQIGSGENRVIDRGAAIGLEVARGLAINVTGLRTDDREGRSEWLSAGVRMPVTRWLELGLERTLSSTGDVRSRGAAARVGFISNEFRLSHRYQWGESDVRFGDVTHAIAREQYQAMAAWTPGPRLNATLQLVTAWNDRGRPHSWEELQTAVRLTSRTTFSIAAPLESLRDNDRLRLRLAQQLPRGFAVTAEYGRVSPFQAWAGDDGRPRARLMISRTVDLATPARGGHVSGRVVDHAGHPVAGARVVLGHYAVTTDATGTYLFHPLQAGTYDLSIDEQFLPASYAWDGRATRLEVTRRTRTTFDLGVTPLNAIHGRVYVDRNANARFDPGEGVPSILVRLGDRVTATDGAGSYSFYNVWPGGHRIALDVTRLPDAFVAGPRVAIEIVLDDDGPATGVDFLLLPKVKPIRWRDSGGR